MRFLRYMLPGLGFVALILVYFMACTGSDSPIEPSTGLDPAQTDAVRGNQILWGLWDIRLDEDRMEFEVVPVRGAAFRVNVNTFIQPPQGSLGNLQINIVDLSQLYSNGECTIDVGLLHPFPGLYTYTGFDVRGVFMHNGSRNVKYATQLRFADPDSLADAILLNADGYTRWFNQTEFPIEGMFGYTPGAMGTQDVTLTARLNPYKSFADGLGAADDFGEWLYNPENLSRRCMFRPSHLNMRRYALQFPLVQGMPQVKFQYAATASWEQPQPTPPVNIPGDFPVIANTPEAYCLSVSDAGSTLWWKPIPEIEQPGDIEPGISGGDLKLHVEVFDHQATGGNATPQIARLGVTSMTSLIPDDNNTRWYEQSELEDMIVGGEGTSESTIYYIEILDLVPVSLKSQELLITAESQNPANYDQGFGTPGPSSPGLASYTLFSQSVRSQIPCPDDIQYATTLKINPTSLANADMNFSGERTLGMRNTQLYAVWCQETVPGDQDICFSRSWNSGGTWSAPVEVNAGDASGDQRSPSIAVPSQGPIYVAYKDASLSPPQIIVCRSTDNGATWTDHVSVHDNSPTGNQWGDWPILGIDESGTVHCAWIDNRLSYRGVFYSRSVTGTTWSLNQKVNDAVQAVNAGQDSLDMFVDTWGGIHAVWSDLRYSQYGSTIFYDYSEDGTDWGPDVRVDHDNSGLYESTSPSVAVDNAGEVHVAWADARASGGAYTYLYYTRSEDQGTSFPVEVRVFDDTTISSPEGMLGPGGVPYLIFRANYGFSDERVLFMYTCDGGDDFIGPMTVVSGSVAVQSPSGLVAANGDVYATYLERSAVPVTFDFFLSRGEPSFP